MDRKFLIGACAWALITVGLIVFMWIRLARAKGRMEDLDAQIARCGELRLGMDETDAVALMGQVEGRFSVTSSTPGQSDVELRFFSGDPGVKLWARLDGRAGKLTETACGERYHLQASAAFLQTLAPGQQPAVGTDAARP